MDQLTLIKIRNPFSRHDRDIVPAPYRHGRTLLDLRNEHFPGVPVSISVNGRVVPDADLGRTYPLAGDHILFVPEVQGGDNSILRSVLMIVVAVVAMYVAGPAGLGFTQGSLGYAVASGAIMIAGGMLVNALLPPPKPQLPTLDSQNNSQAYSWNPQTTQLQGIPVPRFYGTFKLTGNIIGAYIEGSGTANTINVLIGLGVGPMKRLYDFKINDQAVETFKNVSIYENRGTLDQEALLPFQSTKIEYPLWILLNEGSPYTYTTIGAAFDAIEVEITFPQGLGGLESNGLIDAMFVSIGIDVRKAGSSDPWVPLLQSTAGTWVFCTEAHWILADHVWLFGYEFWHEHATGSTNPYDHQEGDASGRYRWHWLQFGEQYSPSSNLVVNYRTFIAADLHLLRYDFQSEGLDPGRYEIRLTRYSIDLPAPTYDDVYLSAVREISRDAFSYPRLAHAAVKALATNQLSGSLRFSCMAECSYVRVWDGAQWTYDASSNPAWVAFDIFTRPLIDAKKSDSLLSGYEWFSADLGLSFRAVRYDGMDPSRLDLVKWKEWADWCDELVPDGKGGVEKRITFNGGFDTRSSVWDAALQVCQVGRATPVWKGTALTIAVDKPSSAVQLFSVGNIGTDSFRETFLKQADRASSVAVDFIDSENGYARDICEVDETEIPGSNSASVSMPGIARRSEAWRYGKYRLYNNLYLTRTVEIDAGIDAIACTIGDVIDVQHDVPQWGFGGRLVAADANTVTLDREVVIESGKSYTVMVRLSDDTVVSRSVANAPGTYAALTVSSPFDVAPQQYDPYAFGETGKVVKPFRVMGISTPQEQNATISAVEYNESVYGCDDEQPVLPTPNYSSLEVLPPVTGLLLSELLVARQDGTIDDVINVYFTPPQSAYYRQAEIWYDNGGGWTYAGTTVSDRFTVTGVRAGMTYLVAVVTVNVLGDRMQPGSAPQASLNTLGKLAPPSDVANFMAVQNGQFVNFSWAQVPDADLWGYEVRQGAQWEGSRVIASGISADQYSWQAELNGTYRFLIKAIDSSGLYSATAAEVDITLQNIDENLNVVLSQDEIAKGGGPDGTKTNFTFDSGTPKNLYITDPSLPAEYISLSIDTGKIGLTTVRIIDTADAADSSATFGSYPDRTFGDYPQDTFGHVTMAASRSIFISYSDDNSAWSAWEPYLGAVQHSFRYIKVKYDASVPSLTASFKLLGLLIMLDVPDVILEIPNFSVTAGTGDNVLFSTYGVQFYSAPVITATLIGGAVNKAPVISSKTATGFHIDLRDKTDASVAGTVDIRASGY